MECRSAVLRRVATSGERKKNRRGGIPGVFRHVGLLFSETLGIAEVLSI
jgi:hypothetical protein